MEVSSFDARLRAFQEGRSSQRAVARRAGIDHARYHRLLRGEVEPASRAQVLAIAAALELSEAETDQLVAAAGMLPPSVSPDLLRDPAFRALLMVSHAPGLTPQSRSAFSNHVAESARWFLAAHGVAGLSSHVLPAANDP